MSIKIPKQFEKLMRKDPACYAGVSQLCLNAEDLFRDSPEFFPDYTIHGIDHINEVLEHADGLIARKTRSKLSPQDIAFLVAAIVIHDLGMFLRADGIRRLVRGDRRHDRIAEIDNCDWEKTWEDFVDRTKRYSEEKMRYLFGRNIRVVGTCVDSSNMTADDKRVIGDFLRQNHPRMAHEIAVFSFPGTQDIDLFARTAFTADDRKMIGLLARSHGKPIRDMEAYIHSEFGRGAKPYNTPVYYLMAVLRIADYLDAGKHRAPVIREKHQKIPVPVSVEEWTWNQRIDRARCRWDLTEKNRYIYARPESSIEFAQLDKWLNSVQSELDTAWSILSEKYTEEPIRLSIHRIVCNIHEPGVRETLNRQFLTEEVKVTANPEITKLMIAPLYGDDPTYGVRELLQNAVDACLERKDKDPTHKGLVTVSIDPWEDPDTGENLGVFTIEDNGIGMDAHVLMNYYLAAGASYRSSEEWQRDFTEDGKSRVARTGRFGVGFLAAFLLGDKVTVTTQHMKEGMDGQGYSFEFTNKAKPLNIRRVSRKKAGTTIRIVLKPGVLEALTGRVNYPWHDWYAFEEPEVRYFLNGSEVQYEGVSLSRDPAKNSDWLSLEPEPFEAYQWNPGMTGNRRGPAFFCNGIRVYGMHQGSTLEADGLKVPLPHVSLLDPNAELDIDLARARLQTFPHIDELRKRTLRYHIARLLMTPWKTEEDHRRNFILGFRLLSSSSFGRIPFMVSPGGFAPNYVSILPVMGIPQYAILYYDGNQAGNAVEAAFRFLPPHRPASIAIGCRDHAAYQEELRKFSFFYRFHDVHDFLNILLSTYRGLFDENAMNYDIFYDHCYFQVSDRIPFAGGYQLGSKYERGRHGAMHLFELGFEKPNRSVVPPITVDADNARLFPVVIQTALDWTHYHFHRYTDPDLLFPRLLRQLLGPNEAHPDRDMWIPFDMEERKKKFPEAFEELEPFFDYIRRNPTV